MSPQESLPPLLSSEEIEGGAVAVELAKTARQKLETTAINATVWTAGAYGLGQSLRLVSNIALTHILLPEFFGIMALVSTITTGIRLLSDVGLLPSVIGSPRGDDPVFLDTAWTIQIVRGILVWLVSLILTFPLAHLYHDRRLLALIPVLSLGSIIDGFASMKLLTASRHIGVRRLLTLEFATQVFTVIVCLCWALIWPSVWALVGGTLLSGVFKTVLSHLPAVMPGRRDGLAWEKASVQSLVHFGKWIMLGTAFYFFASQADRLILGKLISFTMLGVYGVAFTFADIPRQVILQFSYRVGLPFIAKLSHLPLPEFRAQCLKYRLYVLAAGAVILSLVINGGGSLVAHLYDHRYAAVHWMIPILALGLWHTLLYSTSADILIALGKSKYNAIGTGCFCATMFISLPIAFHFGGMLGAVISVAAGDLPFYLVITLGVAREKVSVWKQDGLATAMFLVLLAAGYFVKHLFAGA